MSQDKSESSHIIKNCQFYDIRETSFINEKAFIFAQFNYHLLVWMFHGRKLNNKMNSLHERTLRIVYQDKKPFFKELLQIYK